MASPRKYLRSARRWALPSVAIAISFLAAWMLLSSLRQDVWTVYSDPSGETFEQDDPRARPVLWQDPEPEALGDPARSSTPRKGTERIEATFSSDGATMVLARPAEGRGYDLYSTRWNGRSWSKPEPIAGVNTGRDERSPALSRDGRTLYFASDREGGVGGFDIYVARLSGGSWGDIGRLPVTVNSDADEFDPAPSPDGGSLYFASDRDGDSTDIFVSALDGSGSPAAAQPVDPLNSDGADLRAALTARGDHVFLSSDRDRRGEDGFKVYLSRVRDGKPAPPEEVELYFEGGDVTAPASRMDGFDLLFSARPETGGGESGFTLYRSTTREVVSYTDLSRWEQFKKLMGDIAWWLLLALLALVALIYILEKWRDITSLYHKCLAGSAILHLLALLAAMAFLIVREVERDDGENFEEIEVSIDALAQEELALESIPEQTIMEAPATDMESQKVESEFGATGFEAQETPAAMPDRTETQRESVVAETAPAAAEADTPLPDAVEPASVLGELAAATLPEIDAPTLEEREPLEPVEQMDPADSEFDPATPAPAEVAKAQPVDTTDTAMADVAPAETVTGSAPTQPLAEQARESVVEAATPEALDTRPMAIPDLAPMSLDALPELALEAPDAEALEEPEADGSDTSEPAETDTFDPGSVAAATVASQADTRTASTGEAASGPTAGAGSVAVADTLTTGGNTAAEISATPAAEAASQGEVAMPPTGAAPIGDLPDLAIGDLVGDPSLEEAPADRTGAPADTSGDEFAPDAAAAARLAMVPTANGTPADSADTSATGSTDVTVAQVAASGKPAVEARPPEAVASTTGLPSLPAAPRGPPSLPVAIPIALETPSLNEGAPPTAPPPADTTGDQFDPEGSARALATAPADTGAPPDATASGQSDATSVAKGSPSVSATGAVQARPPEEATVAPDGTVPPSAAGGALSALPDLAPTMLGELALEEPAAPGGGPPDPTAEQFKPGAVAADLPTQPATGGGTLADQADGRGGAETEAVAIANARSNSSAVVASAAPAATSTATPTATSTVTSPPIGASSLAAVDLPTTLEAPAGLDPRGLAREVGKIRGKPGLDAIVQMGGSEGTEGAIGAAIQWLVKTQRPEGHWDTRAHGAKQNFDCAGVGLALLCFYGWGERHDRECDHRDSVRKALDWLLAAQDDNGYLGERPGMMYSHAIATIALCEAYGLTKDARLREPAGRAIAYTLAAQSRSKGGWRYTPGEDSDTSVTGWQFMAMHSARMAGLEVPEENFERARGFLDQMGGGKHGGLYGYQQRGELSRAMVATGMFCRQLDLVPPSDPKQLESARVLKMHPMKLNKPDLYYVYYATLALYQHQGPAWQTWNARLKETLPLIQETSGADAGSWDRSASMTGDGGRVISTTLATLSLEVYYRLLPMYGFRNSEAEAPPAEARE